MPENYTVKINPKPIEQTNNVQLEDIRLMLLDSKPDDYAVVSDDFFFSDEELMDAMRRADEAYNALPPTSFRTGLYGIPDQYTRKIGTCWQACLSKLMYFMRKKVDYSAGSTTVNKYQAQISSFQLLVNMFKEEFKELALLQKKQLNIRRAYGRIG